jgi:hypothetical protein
LRGIRDEHSGIISSDAGGGTAAEPLAGIVNEQLGEHVE